jgi:hypothetical protein
MVYSAVTTASLVAGGWPLPRRTGRGVGPAGTNGTPLPSAWATRIVPALAGGAGAGGWS